ncbi:CASP-like protein 1F2 [Neltuma alba]|uniref:CASP-like protein 1F2 n=1 Tax=Neltuma alba TaxID=207710 RepID=UPI0010A2BFD4|nr:CASP-like protein 1F2 [Prosopis alba]
MADAKDSFMLDAKSPKGSFPPPTPQPLSHHKHFLMAHEILRLLAILLSGASIAVMVTNSQTVTIFSFQYEAHYYYSSSLKFLVAANGIVCGFSLLTLIMSLLLLRRQGSLQRPYAFFFLILHDIFLTVLIISGCAAATAIGYVGQYGESHVGWQAICDRVPKFCKRNMVSLFLSYLAFFAYLGLTILMAYKLMSSPPKN